MRIMILVPSFGRASPIHGAFLFAKYLHARGIDVLFVSLDRNYGSKQNIVDEIAHSGIHFECLEIVGWLGLIRHRARVQEYVRNKSVDIVLSYLLRPDLINSSLLGVIKISSVRGMLRENYAIQYGKFIANRAIDMQIRALKKMDHIFSMSNSMKQWLEIEGLDSDKISIVNNFVDVNLICTYGHYKNNNHLRASINIGLFSNFFLIKRIDLAITAIAEIIHGYEYNNIKIHLAGYGPLRKDMERLARKLRVDGHIIFHGFLPDPLPLMREMDLILLTSDSEGISRCLMEALSLGKTVIAPDIPGIRDLIINGRTGYLFQPGDSGNLAHFIDRIVKDHLYLAPDYLVDFMRQNYDINPCCQSMLDTIERISQEKTGC